MEVKWGEGTLPSVSGMRAEESKGKRTPSDRVKVKIKLPSMWEIKCNEVDFDVEAESSVKKTGG